jgi:hypothetical protein
MGTVSTTGLRNITADAATASGAAITAKTIKGGLVVASVEDGGMGYAVGDILSVTLEGGTGGQVKVTEIGGDYGDVVLVEVYNIGCGYVIGGPYPTVKITGDGNNAATINLSDITRDYRPLTVHGIACGLIANTGGAQCGKVSLRDGAKVVWTGYVYGVVNAAAQGVSKTFPIEITFTPLTSVNVLYAAVTNATTAAVSLVWSV